MKDPKEGRVVKGAQERAEKMVKGSLGSILLSGGGGEEGVKRSVDEKSQQQRQQSGNTGTKVPKQQQQQQMANRPIKPELKPTGSPPSAPKRLPAPGTQQPSESRGATFGAELNGGLSGAELNGGLSGAQLALEKRRKVLEGWFYTIVSFHC